MLLVRAQTLGAGGSLALGAGNLGAVHDAVGRGRGNGSARECATRFGCTEEAATYTAKLVNIFRDRAGVVEVARACVGLAFVGVGDGA